MNIGETIKKLRKQKDMTQEQLAEYLNITTQAVSKWETNLSLPDITLIPVLANIFDVTSDVLLGIDITVKENRIKDIIKQANQVQQYGFFDAGKAVEILRAGLKEYPNSYEIMAALMMGINSIRYDSQGRKDDDVILLLNEVINLGEKVLAECTNDKCRYRAIRELCSAYSDPVIGEADKAKDLAEKMPRFSEGREFLLECIYQGDEQLTRMQENMGQCLLSLIGTMYNYICHIFGYDGPVSSYNDYTIEDGIILCKKFITLIEVMFESGDYESYGQFMSNISTKMAMLYVKLKDFESAIKALQFSAEYAIKFDFDTEHIPDPYLSPAKPKPSLLFKNIRVNCTFINTNESAAMSQLKSMKQTPFDPIRDTKEFIEIEEKLKSMQKKED